MSKAKESWYTPDRKPPTIDRDTYNMWFYPGGLPESLVEGKPLSEPQAQVLRYLRAGYRIPVIAERMKISNQAAWNQRADIIAKGWDINSQRYNKRSES